MTTTSIPNRIEHLQEFHPWLEEDDARLLLVFSYKSYHDEAMPSLSEKLEDHMAIAVNKLSHASRNKLSKLLKDLHAVCDSKS